MRTIGHSRFTLAIPLVGVAVILVLVPLTLSAIFQQVTQDRQDILARSLQAQGRIVAAAIAPVLTGDEPTAFAQAMQELVRFSPLDAQVRLLFRDNTAANSDDFHIVGGTPAADPSMLDSERRAMVRQGLFAEVGPSCASDGPQIRPYQAPSGADARLAAILPLQGPGGCWVLVFAYPAADLVTSALDASFWQRGDVQRAAVIYLALALLLLVVFLAVRASFARFGRLARAVSRGGAADGSFVQHSELVELDDVASELDRMVAALRRGGERIRQRAEDQAHALKGPISVMRQSLVPLRREIGESNQRARRALDVMSDTVDRLDGLVDEGRRLSVSVAQMLDPPRRHVNLSRLLHRTLRGYGELAEGLGVEIEAELPEGLSVLGNETLIGSAIEAVLDDVIGASAGRRIEIQLLRTSVRAEIAVAGHGAEIPAEYRHRIFEPEATTGLQRSLETAGWTPAGAGLRRARQKLQTIGGGIQVANAPGEGLLIFLDLPVLNAPPSGRQLRRMVVLGLQTKDRVRSLN